MTNIDNFISIGQDCSTLLFIKNRKNYRPGFFDGLVVYSDDYLKFFDKDFLSQNQKIISVYCKSTFNDILSIYEVIKQKNKKTPIRLNFSAICGGKYNFAYIDAIHIDNDILYNLTETTDLSTFLKKIEIHAIPYVKTQIIKNIENQLKIFDDNDQQNLFVRSIKHFMNQQEVDDLLKFNSLLRNLFPKSKFLVITDIQENLKYNLEFLRFFVFDHWKSSVKSLNEFNEIVDLF